MKKKRLAVVSLISALAVGAGAFTFGALGGDEEAKTYHADAFFAFDPENKRKLVGFAEHVFLGRVTEKVGSEGKETTNPGTAIPQTQYRVTVLKALKGDVSGDVTLNQEGGYDAEDNSFILMEGDPLLKPGEVYLFTAKRNPSTGWLSIVAPGYADIRITSPRQQADIVKEFEEAIRHQESPQ